MFIGSPITSQSYFVSAGSITLKSMSYVLPLVFFLVHLLTCESYRFTSMAAGSSRFDKLSRMAARSLDSSQLGGVSQDSPSKHRVSISRLSRMASRSLGSSQLGGLSLMSVPTSFPNAFPTSSPTMTEKDTKQFNKEVNLARIGVASLLLCMAAFTPQINAHIASGWEYIKVQGWFRHDMFEPMVAVCSFFLWIHLWMFQDMRALNGKNDKLLRWRISSTDVQSKWYSGWWKKELPLYLVPLYLLSISFDAFAPRRMALLQAAPSVWRIFQEVGCGLFLYDFFFFISHFAMHRVPGLDRFHSDHHIANEARASDTVRLTAVEEFTDVACSIAALRLMRAHPLSRACYNIVITGLLTELHCGYNIPQSLQNIVPLGLWAGSGRHHLHHQHSFKGYYYQKFFTYLDNIFGLVHNKANYSI